MIGEGESAACVGAHSPRRRCLSDYDAETVSDSPRVDPARTRPLVNARHCLLSTVLICVALAGCGGSGSSRAAAHLAAVANAICRESHTNRATGAPFEVHMKAEFAKVRALIHSDRKLPRVATLIGDLAASQREQVALRKLSRKASNGSFFSRRERDGANAFSLLNESYRLEVKVQADLKALGLTSCLGPPPRKLIVG
jgi:hypothetical protein